jgi:hypothetical protein
MASSHPKLRWLLQLLGFEILPHTSYFPDLAPSDFYLFSKLKAKLRGGRLLLYIPIFTRKKTIATKSAFEMKEHLSHKT